MAVWPFFLLHSVQQLTAKRGATTTLPTICLDRKKCRPCSSGHCIRWQGTMPAGQPNRQCWTCHGGHARTHMHTSISKPAQTRMCVNNLSAGTAAVACLQRQDIRACRHCLLHVTQQPRQPRNWQQHTKRAACAAVSHLRPIVVAAVTLPALILDTDSCQLCVCQHLDQQHAWLKLQQLLLGIRHSAAYFATASASNAPVQPSHPPTSHLPHLKELCPHHMLTCPESCW